MTVGRGWVGFVGARCRCFCPWSGHLEMMLVIVVLQTGDKLVNFVQSAKATFAVSECFFIIV